MTARPDYTRETAKRLARQRRGRALGYAIDAMLLAAIGYCAFQMAQAIGWTA